MPVLLKERRYQNLAIVSTGLSSISELLNGNMVDSSSHRSHNSRTGAMIIRIGEIFACEIWVPKNVFDSEQSLFSQSSQGSAGLEKGKTRFSRGWPRLAAAGFGILGFGIKESEIPVAI